MKKEFIKWKEKNSNLFNIEKGTTNNINLEMQKPIYSTIPINKEKLQKISINITCNTNLVAPININSEIGAITCKIDDTILLQTNIRVINAINKKNLFNYLNEFIKKYKYITIKM